MTNSYTKVDGSISEYDAAKYARDHYQKISQATFKCECCNKTIKAVSKVAHERGKAHIRAQELYDKFIESADYTTDSN